jgi:hypothetical protein
MMMKIGWLVFGVSVAAPLLKISNIQLASGTKE